MHSLPTARWVLRLAWAAPSRDADDALAECLGAADEAGDRPGGAPPAWLRRARERIRDECTRKLRVSSLAGDAGVHPVYLTREFRRWYGTSVSGCIQEERLRRAADGLARSAEPIAGVAFGSGFADQPHLTRAFQRALGVTPAAYRRSAGPTGV
jgi:AraC family transcriptional regulator